MKRAWMKAELEVLKVEMTMAGPVLKLQMQCSQM